MRPVSLHEIFVSVEYEKLLESARVHEEGNGSNHAAFALAWRYAQHQAFLSDHVERGNYGESVLVGVREEVQLLHQSDSLEALLARVLGNELF